jgi:hypothetical protein
VFADLKEAKVLAKDYRDHYNQQRPHGALGYLTPMEFAAIEALSQQAPSQQAPKCDRGVRIGTQALIVTGTDNGVRSSLRFSGT